MASKPAKNKARKGVARKPAKSKGRKAPVRKPAKNKVEKGKGRKPAKNKAAKAKARKPAPQPDGRPSSILKAKRIERLRKLLTTKPRTMGFICDTLGVHRKTAWVYLVELGALPTTNARSPKYAI